MKKQENRYLYGPVSSWRLGRSLGIDALSGKKKNCSFNCVYCQIGRAAPCPKRRKIFVPTKKIIDELKRFPRVPIDYLTFSGMGEPTLAKNLGQIIKHIRKIRREKIAVITNSSLIDNAQVRKEIKLADLVMAKLDCCGPELLNKVNHPVGSVTFDKMVRGLKKLRSEYKGKLALQIMFVKENKKFASRIAEIAKDIAPDEVQINTPLRKNKCAPLSKQEIAEIKKFFHGFNIVSVYDQKRKKTKPISSKETVRRRGQKD
ncbi:MAG: radical SAM protein [Candidatus Omnitrophota bacterium]